MQKKKHAAIAIALVTGGISAPSVSKAGLFSTPVQNGGFDYDYTHNPNGLGYDYQLHNWFRYSGGEVWQSQANQSISFPGSFNNSAYAIVQGQSYRGAAASNNLVGDIFQQIGTTQANQAVTVNFLEAYLQGSTSNSVTVSLFSGGSPVRTYGGYTGGYNVYGPTYTLTGATLLSSTSFASGSTADAFAQETATLNTGAAGTKGAALWLDFTVNNTAYGTDQIAIDNVTATSTTTPQSTWTGAASSNWNTTALNFGATAYVDGNAVLFDDSATGSTAVTINTANVTPTQVTFNNSSKNYTISGSYGIAGGAQLTKNGTGTVSITNANSFTGNVYVNAGVLNLQNSSALGTSTGVYVASGGTLQLQGGITIGGAVGGSLPLTLSGAGTGATGHEGALVSLSGSNTYSGKIFLDSAATIAVDSGSLLLNESTDVMTDGVGPGYDLTLTGAGNGEITAKIGGGSNVIKNGTGSWKLDGDNYFAGSLTQNGGTLTLSGENTNSGGTTVNAGTLILTYGGYAGAIRGTLNIASGATVTLATDDALGYGSGDSVNTINVSGTLNNTTNNNEGYITDYVLTGGTISSTGGGDYAFTGGYSISSNASSVTSVFSGPIVMREGSSTMVFTVALGTTPSGIDLNVSGVISEDDRAGTGAQFGVDKEGPGLLALTGSNTYPGATTINGGTLMLGDGTVGHDGALNPTGGIVNNAALVFNTAVSQNYGGAISGSGTIAKIGPGSLTLSGGSSYSGPVTVSAGKVYVDGSFGTSSTFNVSSGATLGGTGSVTSAVTLATGGIIEAGQAGTGELTINGNTTFAGTGTINLGSLTNYSGSPGVNFAGGITASGGSGSIALNVATATGASVGSTYQLINYSGSSPLSDLKVGIGGRATGTVTDTGSQIDITLTSLSSAIVYTGAAGKVWNTTAQSWTINSAATAYIDSPGDAVVFDDTAPSANTALAINTATVHPSSVTFNNSTNTYTINGPYGIAGLTGITLNGTGVVNINTPNTFTGPVVVNSGTLQLGNGTSGNDGTISAASSITNNGALTFNYFSNQTISAPISGTGNISKSGAGNLTLTAGQSSAGVNSQTDSGTLTINGGAVTLAPSDPTTPAYATQGFSGITVNAGGTLDIASVHTFGYAGGYGGNPRTPITINGGTVTNSQGNDNYLGTITMTGGTINGTGEFRLQDTGASTDVSLTTLPTTTTATISVPSLALVTYGGNTNITFNVSAGTVASGPDLLVSSSIDSSGGLVKAGSGVMTLTGTNNTYSGGTFVTAGTLNFSGPKTFPVASALNISSGALAVVTSHTGATPTVLQATSLSFSGTSGSWGGKLDLNNNDIVIHGGSLSDTTSQVQYAYNGGAWNGPGGITSTAAATNAKHLTTLGVIVNDNGSGTPLYGSGGSISSTFDGDANVADGDILVKYTYYGDTNLDGAVDGSDYSKIDAGFTSGGTLTGWANGDFNYDGKIDGSDYTLIDNAFNTQGATLGSNPAALIASSTAQFSGGSAVPEPTTLGMLGLGAIGLIAKRRRRSC